MKRLKKIVGCAVIICCVLTSFLSVGAIAQKPKFKGVTLHVSMIDEIREREIIKRLPVFEKETGIKVKVDLYGFEGLFEHNLTAAYSRTGEYDVMQLHHPDLALFSRYLVDLTDRIKRDWKEIDVDDIHPLLRKTHMQYQDRWYGVPTHVNPMTLVYRTDIFKKYGFEVPKTWDETIEVAKKITERLAPDTYGITFMGRKEIQVACTFLNFLGGYGQYILEETDRGLKPSINTPKAVTALEKLVALKPWAVPGVLGYGFDENMMAFARGKAAMSLMWSSIINVYQDPAQSVVVDKWDLAPMPGSKQPDGSILSKSLLGGWTVAISKDCPNPEAAWEFLKWLISKKLEKELVPYYESCRVSLLSDPEIQKEWPNYKAFYEILEAGPIDFPGVRPGIKIVPNMEMLDAMEIAISDALTDVATPKEALDTLQSKYMRLAIKWGLYK